MRVTLAIAAATVLMHGPAGAAMYEGPWCAVQTLGDNMATYNCQMRTFEQCRLEVIAGNRGTCVQNARWPGWYNGTGDQLTPVRKRRAR
jgi:Protein of unknown function (DUF3551)